MANTTPKQSEASLVAGDEHRYVRELIREIVTRCPQRSPASRDERRAQEILALELEQQGGRAEFLPFRFNVNLFAVIALHFGLAALASALIAVNPLSSLILHLVVAVSYTLDSTRRAYLLRRLFPFRRSQNLVVTFPPPQTPRLRLVLVAHADAAFTGLQFREEMVRGSAERTQTFPWRWTRRPLLIAVLLILWLIPWDIYLLVAGQFWPRLWVTYAPCGIYFLIICLLNLEVAVRRQVVPGANDNLTGCAALPVLARRLLPELPGDVELVCVVTGCEEAGNGGAVALARAVRHRWARRDTIVLCLDSLSNGRLRIFRDGEVLPPRFSPWLQELALNVAARDPRFANLTPYGTPAGGTDAIPFAGAGYDHLSLGRVDDDLGVPRHYHRPSDTPENLDYGQLMESLDFAEQLAREVMAVRSRPAND